MTANVALKGYYIGTKIQIDNKRNANEFLFTRWSCEVFMAVKNTLKYIDLSQPGTPCVLLNAI